MLCTSTPPQCVAPSPLFRAVLLRCCKQAEDREPAADNDVANNVGVVVGFNDGSPHGSRFDEHADATEYLLWCTRDVVAHCTC